MITWTILLFWRMVWENQYLGMHWTSLVPPNHSYCSTTQSELARTVRQDTPYGSWDLDNTCSLHLDTYVVYTIIPYILHPFKHDIYIVLTSLYSFTSCIYSEEPHEERCPNQRDPYDRSLAPTTQDSRQAPKHLYYLQMHNMNACYVIIWLVT